MAHAQKWTRNISKKIKKSGPPLTQTVVDPHSLDKFKRRAEDLGMIIHSQSKPAGKKRGGKG